MPKEFYVKFMALTFARVVHPHSLFPEIPTIRDSEKCAYENDDTGTDRRMYRQTLGRSDGRMVQQKTDDRMEGRTALGPCHPRRQPSTTQDSQSTEPSHDALHRLQITVCE